MANPKTQIEVSVLDKASAALAKIKDKFAGLNGGKVGGAMAQVQKAAGQSTKVLGAYAAAGGIAAAGAGFLAKSVIDTAGEFERYSTILTTLEGSEGKAKESMMWISDFAAKTPYEMGEVTDAFVKLKAYGLDPMKDGLLNSLGDTAAAMGKPVMDAVEAIADAVTGENERLKAFGIKAGKVKGSNQIEYTFTDKDGKQQVARAAADNREQIQKTLQSIWNQKYGGAMDKLSGTWEGMLSNLSDQWERFKLMLANAGVFDFLKEKLSGFLATLDKMAADGSLKEMAENIGGKLTDALEKLWEWGNKLYDKFVEINDFFGGFENTLTAVAAVAALPLVAAFINIAVAVGTLGVAMFGALPAVAAFGAALLANPLTWIIAGIVAVVGATAYLASNWKSVSAKLAAIWEEIKTACMAAFDAVAQWLSGAWESIKSTFSAAFDFIVGLFLNFTPLGLMMQAMGGLLGYVVENWEGIKAAISGALSSIGTILSSFDPLGFVSAAFERLKSFVGGIFDGIVGKARQILGISQEANAAARSMPSPASLVQGNAALGKVSVNINHSNIPRGTTTKVAANNRVNLTQRQGFAFAHN